MKTVNRAMSSLEIAELTGKRHKNIIRDIEKQLDGQEISRLRFEGTYRDAQNKERSEACPTNRMESACWIS